MDEWHPQRKSGFQDFAALFAASDRGLPGAREYLVRYLETRPPPIVTASVLDRLAELEPDSNAIRNLIHQLRQRQ
ncbi:MAG TPA: hypothetical protein VKN63_09950 [Afifellaceae bacterium]|nr:hypothetical protein [Afifellaceae bacterium]